MARVRILKVTLAWASARMAQPLSMLSAFRAQLPRKLPVAILASAVIALAGMSYVPAQADDDNISSRRSSERTSFSNEEITDGFFKIAFGAELQLGKRVERIRKFDEAVRVFVFDQGEHRRRAEIATIVADIAARVDNLDLAMTDDLQTANLVVMLVRKRDLKQTIRSVYGRDKARRIERSLSPQCLSGFGRDESYRIRHAEVILPVDADDFVFYDCAYEELLQALGPNNDDSSVPWTMFNDDVQMGFFDVYDQYLLNILYDPRVRPGMTKDQVAQLLPEVLPAVRERIGSGGTRQFRSSSSADPEGRRRAPAPPGSISLE